jgi:hypothetical protein
MTTALDHVNVRRIMFYIEKQIRHRAYERSFEWKTLEERFIVHEQCTIEVLEDVKSRRGIFDFKIEHVNPTRYKAIINYREGREPIIIEWWSEQGMIENHELQKQNFFVKLINAFKKVIYGC